MIRKKYIAYARMKCSPRLTEDSGEALKNYYVEVRNRAKEKKSKKGNDIPVTVRQLEAVIRMSEAIAKMELSNVVTKKHVDEARRLFELSTMSAAKARKEFGLDIPAEMRGEVVKVEDALKRKISVNQKVQVERLFAEMGERYHERKLVDYALTNLINRQEFSYLEERKIV